jgi:hypothetical protein
MENFVIYSLASLEAEGFSVAFVAGNRSINEKNIKSKKGSFEEFKCNLVPLLFVKGEKAVADGCTLVDSTSGKEIQNAKADSYIVVLDGQHRYTAAIESELPHERIYLFEDYSGANTKKLLATSNVDSFPWNASDFIGGAVLFNPENEMAKFAKELTDLDYPSSTISHILCFKGGKITKRQYAKIMQGESVSIDECDIERGKLFLESARTKFKDEFISKRYLITVVESLSIKNGYVNVFKAIEALDEKDIKRILAAKSDDKTSVIKTCLEAILKEK